MNELKQAEKELYELTNRVAKLRRDSKDKKTDNYSFQTLEGEVTLLDLFAGKDTLFLIHNMGQGCRYCTLWADGFNGFVPHLESEFAVAMVSKDTPETQRRFANSRNWRFKMASHGGGQYIKEQNVYEGKEDGPGMACYIRKGTDIFLKNSVSFGPGDEFCSQWNILSLAGLSHEEWTPQYDYWKRPKQMDDGGQNLN